MLFVDICISQELMWWCNLLIVIGSRSIQIKIQIFSTPGGGGGGRGALPLPLVGVGENISF